MLEHRRSWQVTVDGHPHTVDVIYGALFGWMSIEIDGVQQVRAWREFQTVWGGADLTCAVDGHVLAARITQPYGRQHYSFALTIDGAIQEGSDLLPPAGGVRRQTLLALGTLAVTVFVIVMVSTLAQR